METSDKIRQRIKEAGAKFNSNHNISEFIEDGELEQLQKEVECAFQGVLNLSLIHI